MICLMPGNSNVRHVTIRFNGNEILDVWCNKDSNDILMVVHSVPESPTSIYTDPKHLLLHNNTLRGASSSSLPYMHPSSPIPHVPLSP